MGCLYQLLLCALQVLLHCQDAVLRLCHPRMQSHILCLRVSSVCVQSLDSEQCASDMLLVRSLAVLLLVNLFPHQPFQVSCSGMSHVQQHRRLLVGLPDVA